MLFEMRQGVVVVVLFCVVLSSSTLILSLCHLIQINSILLIGAMQALKHECLLFVTSIASSIPSNSLLKARITFLFHYCHVKTRLKSSLHEQLTHENLQKWAPIMLFIIYSKTTNYNMGREKKKEFLCLFIWNKKSEHLLN